MNRTPDTYLFNTYWLNPFFRQKLVCLKNIESKTRYILGRMQYAPTLTDQKFDSHLSIESSAWYVWGCRPSRPIHSWRGTLKICMNASKTRREWDEYGHIHAKPAGDRTNIAIFARNPPGMGWIWPYSRKTRRGWDEYGHIHAKPAGDGTNMAIFTQNPPGIRRIWPYSRKTRREWDEYGHSYAKPAGDLTNMAIFTRNPPGMGWIWLYSRKTRRGFDEYGHIHAKPAEDRTDMAISTQNPPRMG